MSILDATLPELLVRGRGRRGSTAKAGPAPVEPAGSTGVASQPGHDRRRSQLRAPTPFVDALQHHLHRDPLAFSCPGHKGGAGADPRVRAILGDGTFGADVWLDTQTYDQARRTAEDHVAALWGAERAFILVNGSTSGNQALLLATLRPGDTVVCARDVHVSTHSALVMTGAVPVWLEPDQDPSWGVGTGITPHALAATLDANPDTRLVVVVSPSYAGVCSDLPRLVAVAHARGVPIVVDEAWGPHLRFGAVCGLPVDALTAGADAAITSTHKLLTSLSQSSVLLVQGGRLALDRVAAAVRMTQTTSPYLPLVASVDSCRAQLEEDGTAMVCWAVDLARLARTLLGRVPGLRVLNDVDLPSRHGNRNGYGGLDPCKIVVDVRGRGLDGPGADRVLREEHGIAVEGSDPERIYLVVGPGDSVAGVRRLAQTLATLGSPGPGPTRVPLPRAPKRPAQSTSPREAYFASSERVALGDAAGRVCAELVTPYPPGIPLLVPGELISDEIVTWLVAAVDAGVHLHGPDDPMVTSLRVLADRASG